MWEIQISMKTWEKSEKAALFFQKLLNGKIRAAPLAAATHICISSELVHLFLFYLVYNGLNLRFSPRFETQKWDAPWLDPGKP